MADALIISVPAKIKRALPYFVRAVARKVISGDLGYFQAEDLLLFSTKEWPAPADMVLDKFADTMDRYWAEQLRVMVAIREKCVPMISAGVKPERIKAAAEKLDPGGLVGAEAIREILRAEWVKARQ